MMRTIILLGVLLIPGCATLEEPPRPQGAMIPAVAGIVIDGAIEQAEWEGARRYQDAFVIDQGNPYSGVRSFELRVAREDQALLVALAVNAVDPQPYTKEGGPWYPHKVRFYLATGDRDLLPPASDAGGSEAMAFSFSEKLNVTTLATGIWRDGRWVVPQLSDYKDNATPEDFATRLVDRTLTQEVRIPADARLHDGVQFTGPTDLRLDVQFGIQLGAEDEPGRNQTIAIWGHVKGMDNWPGDGQNEWGHVDPRGWLRLRWE